MTRRTLRAAWIALLVVTLSTWIASPASAAYDDGFLAHTAYSSKCSDWGGYAGYVYFIDYGEGDLSNPGKNDDYLTIKDTCPDGDGVRAYAWINDSYLGSRYNGNGYGEYVFWDPFGNVLAGDVIHIAVCRVDGPNGARQICGESYHRSVDG